MSIYRENKNFINKFVKVLDSHKRESINTTLSIYFINNLPANAVFLYVASLLGDIVIEDAGKRLYFGVELKEKSRNIEGEELSHKSLHEVALRLYTSKLSIYNIDEDNVKEMRNFIKSKGILKNLNGHDYESMNNYNFIRDLKNNYVVLDGYPKVDETEKNIKNLLNADIDIKLHPDVFKQLKNRKIIPVAYIDGDNSDLCYPTKSTTSRKSTSIFRKVSLGGIGLIDSNSLRNIAERAFMYTPFNLWSYYEMNFDGLNEKVYKGYNFDL